MVEIKRNVSIDKQSGLITKLQDQKDILLKEITDIEDRLHKTEEIYRRYLPYILELAIDSGTSASSLLKDLKESLRKKSSYGRIEYIFKQIHDSILKEGPAKGEKKEDSKESSDATKPSGKLRIPDFLNL